MNTNSSFNILFQIKFKKITMQLTKNSTDHRKILTFTLQNCLLYHKIKIVMVTNNNDTIQHVAKVITQVLLMMLGKKYKYVYRSG
jgi:hypothetical protein